MAQAEQFINWLTGQPMALLNAIGSVFGASGTNHSVGLVPDPGSSAGTTHFLREDGTWQNITAASILPTPTRAGDIIYWNGSTWVTLAGNNSGTQFLQETSAGVPSWATTSITSITNSLGADVTLTSAGAYFDGPSVAQGNTGTWLATGTVTIGDNQGTTYDIKLWDGTTVISSSAILTGPPSVITPFSVALSGIITSPAGNIKISVQAVAGTTNKLLFNKSGNSKDCTVTAIRLA